MCLGRSRRRTLWRIVRIVHSFSGIAELLGKLQQANLGADDLLFSRRGVLQCAEAGRFATPTAPRPASARDSPWAQDTSARLSFSFCNGPGEVKPPK